MKTTNLINRPKQTGFRLSVDQEELLTKVALAEDLSKSDIIRRALRQFLEPFNEKS